MTQSHRMKSASVEVQERPKLPEIELSARWVRVAFSDSYVADSRRALLVRDGYRLTYFFPEEDVATEHLQVARRDNQGKQKYDVKVGDRVASAAAWGFEQPSPRHSALRGYIAFDWRKMDHWYEEEEEVFVHPRDPYHRIDTARSSRHVRVEVDGVTVAETDRPVLLFETGLPVRYYIPEEDIRMEFLEPTNSQTGCPYKGFASYWSVKVNGETYRDLVWAYLEPFLESQKIAGLLCFYNEKVDLTVDGELQPRPETPWS